MKKHIHFMLGAVLATFPIGATIAAEQPASELHLQPESNRRQTA